MSTAADTVTKAAQQEGRSLWSDALLRLPVGNPVLNSFEDPVLKMCYLALLALFLIGITFQLRWIQRHAA